MNYIEDYFSLVGVDTKYISDFMFLGKSYSIIPSSYKSMSLNGFDSEKIFDSFGGLRSMVKTTDLFIFYSYLRDKNPTMKILYGMNIETEVLNNMYDALFYRAVVRHEGGISDWAERFTKRADFKSVVLMPLDVLSYFDKSLVITYETLKEVLKLL